MSQRGIKAGRIVSVFITTCILVLSSRCAWGEERISVAVLPFSASIDNKELEGLDRALSEMLITDLMAVQSIELVERGRLNEVLKEIQLGKEGFVDPSTAATIGKGVGAKAILTGSFFANGDKLRIDARLIHVESGTVLVAEEITGSSTDPFELEKKLQQKLIDAMGVRLSALEKAEIEAKPDADAGAAAAYGRAQALNEAGEKDAAKAEAEKALLMAPNFKQARSLLESLEERVSQIEEDVVAVKEVRLKRVRESEDDDFLFKHLKDPETEVRLEAAFRLKSHHAELAEMATEEVRAFEASGDVIDNRQFNLAMVLVNKLDDEEAASAILFESTHPLVKALALSKIRTPELLKKAFLGGMGQHRPAYSYPRGDSSNVPDPTSPYWWWNFTVQEARKRVSNQSDVLELCKAGDSEFVQLVEDKGTLEELATSSELNASVRARAQEQVETLPADKVAELIDAEMPLDHLVGKLTDECALMDVALRAFSYDKDAAEFAARKISDPEKLRAMAVSDADESIRKIAVCRIADPSVLAAVSERTRGSGVADTCDKLLAYLAMDEREKVEAISRETFNDELRDAYIENFGKQNILQDMLAPDPVFAPNVMGGYRLSSSGERTVINQITDQKFLQTKILSTTDHLLRRAAFDRIMQLPDWEGMDTFLATIAADNAMAWRSAEGLNSTEMQTLYYGDTGDGRWGLCKFSPYIYMRFSGETEWKAYELRGVLEIDPGIKRRRQAFLRIRDYSAVEKDFIAVYDDYVQQHLAEKLGEQYVHRAISLALQDKRYVPPSLIEACNDQNLLVDYLDAFGNWEDNRYGNVLAARAERALLAKVNNISLLSNHALLNTDSCARDISISRLEDKSALDKIAAESLYFDTQRMAREKLARLP